MFEIQPDVRNDSYLMQGTNVLGDTQQTIYLNNPKDLQDSIVQDLISVALGQQRFKQQNQTEFFLDLIWMVIGIAFFSQVIGNMSMYISQMNLNNLEFQNKMKIIDNLSQDSNVSQELIKLLTNSLEQNKNKFENYSVDQLKPQLTKDIWRQLNRELQTDFISLFKLFEKIDFDSLPKLKAICYFKENKNVQKLNSIVNELQLVVEGKIKIFDEKMKQIREQVENELIGFEDFSSWYKQIKQEMDSNENKKQNGIMNEKYFSRRITLAIGSDDVRQIQISYSNLAELMLQDKSLYSKFEMYYEWQKEAIGLDDIKNTKRLMQQFNNNENPGLIILKKGMVQMHNKKFKEKFNFDLVGSDINKFIFNLDWSDLKLNKISGQQVQFLQSYHYQKLKVENTQKMLIIRRQNDDKEIELKKMDCHFLQIIEYLDQPKLHLSKQSKSKISNLFKCNSEQQVDLEQQRNKIKQIIKNSNPDNNLEEESVEKLNQVPDKNETDLIIDNKPIKEEDEENLKSEMSQSPKSYNSKTHEVDDITLENINGNSEHNMNGVNGKKILDPLGDKQQKFNDSLESGEEMDDEEDIFI